MEEAKQILEPLGLRISKDDTWGTKCPIEFVVEDDEQEYAWVWGTPNDIEWECDHPSVIYGDKDERAECPICGSTCDWDDEGPITWYKSKELGGVLKKCLDEYKEGFILVDKLRAMVNDFEIMLTMPATIKSSDITTIRNTIKFIEKGLKNGSVSN